jgi:hypothetical protein
MGMRKIPVTESMVAAGVKEYDKQEPQNEMELVDMFKRIYRAMHEQGEKEKVRRKLSKQTQTITIAH